ncbi:hypothetical protein ABZ419_11470 [Streptomyces cinnamoneus]|uniref:hypothetical protein n=1 Tax=Streptomyces cinnamoneus TaxID=53446 RepID=UPI0033C78030
MAASAKDLASLVQEQQAAEAAALEEQAAQEADGGAGAAVAAVLTAALAGWVSAFGALAVAGAGTQLTGYLFRVRRDTDRALEGLDRRAFRAVERHLPEATRLGARHALAFARLAGGGRGKDPTVSVSQETVAAAREVAGLVREQVRLAARLLSPRMVSLTGWRGVVAGIAAARRAVTLVRAAVAWSTFRAIRDGAAQAIAALKARGLWVSEPDACVRCLAYAGRLSDQDGRFPGGLALDPEQARVNKAALDGPPLHAHCRCRLVPWREEWAQPGRMALPDLLREQAWRSVAAGRARPSESRAARLRAARFLLAQRGVPAGVRRQAQAAVSAGRF